MFRVPTIASTAAYREPSSEPRANERSSPYDAKSIHRTRNVVRRASHVHHVPQAVRAQIEPVIRTMVAKLIATLMEACAAMSHSDRPFARNTALATPPAANPKNDAVAAGTW